MEDEIIRELESLYEVKVFLTMEDVTSLLDCKPTVVYNWIKRADVKKRPPRIMVGKSMRFPKKSFIRWLVKEQKCLEAIG